MRLAGPSIPDLTARRSLARTSAARSDTLRHLSSGVRVAKAADAPATLIASELVRADQTRSEQVRLAAGLARGATAVAERALASVNENLLELRALTSQAYGNTISRGERDAMQQQADKLVDEIDRVLSGATYKGRRLFNPPPAPVADDPLTLDTAGYIGSPPAPGSHTDDTPIGTPAHSGRDYTITAGGYTWASRDQTYFIRTSLTGDGVIEAVAEDFTSADLFGKSGVMWRESDDPRAPAVMVNRFFDGRVTMQYREVYNGPTTSAGGGPMPDVPTHLRLTRNGNTFTSEVSLDGVNYTTVLSRTIAMSPTARVGITHNPNDYAGSGSGSFTGVRLAAGLTPPSQIPPPTIDIPRPDAGTLAGDPATPEQTALVFNLGTGMPDGFAALRFGQVASHTLGTAAHNVRDLRAGGELDLRNADTPDEATRAVEAAIREVAVLRGRVGNFERHVVEPMDRQGTRLGVELADAGSDLRDTDVAEATADLARLDVLRESIGDVLRIGYEQQRQALALLG